jgi:hypothetical protein
MMVAYIAYQNLTPKAQSAVNHLLKVATGPGTAYKQSQDFVNAAHWADDIRSVTHQYNNWHFIDQPFSPDGTKLPPVPSDNIVVELHNQVAVFSTPGATEPQKAQALRFIIHFVGDIHQPLHCATRVTAALPSGDQGGNLFPIKVANKSTPNELHALWDGGLLAFPSGNPPSLSSISPAVQPLLTKYHWADTDWQGAVDDFEGWAAESLNSAENTAYAGISPNATVSKTYLNNALPVAQKRVAWGGFRLAALLNDIFK